MDDPAEAVAHFASLARVAYEEEIRYPAAALAYYGFVSFVPFLVLAFAVMGEQLTAELSRRAPQFLTPRVRDLVSRSLETAAGRTGAGLLAVAVLAWSSVNVVGDIRTVIERVEGSIGTSHFHRVRDALTIFGSLGAAFLAILATSLLLDFPPAGPVFGLVGFAVLWAALAVAFVPLYYVPSGVVTAPTEALPGAVTAAFGWTVLHTFVQFYAHNAGQYAIYGVLSGIIIILTTLYLAAALLLTGIIVNAQIATDSSLAGE